jgi:hypothetical protein
MGTAVSSERRSAARARLAGLAGRGASESQALQWSAPHVATFIELIGLKEYKHIFLENGVDGSTLLELRRDQFERCLGVSNPLHEISLRYALMDLTEQQIDYTRWEWSCVGVVQWLGSRGLEALMQRFCNAAVHGGVLFRLRKVEFASRLFVGEHGESELVLESLWHSIQRAKKHGFFVDTSQFPDWGPVEIRTWLESIHLGHLNALFREHCVNGTLLPHLDESALRRTMKLTEVQTIVVTKAIRRLMAQAAPKGALGALGGALAGERKGKKDKGKVDKPGGGLGGLGLPSAKSSANQENSDPLAADDDYSDAPAARPAHHRTASKKAGYASEPDDMVLHDRTNAL